MRKAGKKNLGNKANRNRINLTDSDKPNICSIKNSDKKEEKEGFNNKEKQKFELREDIVKTDDNLVGQKLSNNDKRKKVKFIEKDSDTRDKKRIFDNYELNNMDYYDAVEYDKRSCLSTYCSVLKREHYFILTFFSGNDYNLFYIKIERFFILICTVVTMNGMFFVHETMHKKQTGDTSFAQKIPQIIFSLLVYHLIEIILCFFSMTDKHYYEIKALPKKEKIDKRVIDILDCMKRKLIGFFIFTFLLFLFHWYFISAFCAVYQNTQSIYLRDSAISILTSLIDPFIIYGLTCLLRAISLTIICKKKLSCIYKLANFIPLF